MASLTGHRFRSLLGTCDFSRQTTRGGVEFRDAGRLRVAYPGQHNLHVWPCRAELVDKAGDSSNNEVVAEYT